MSFPPNNRQPPVQQRPAMPPAQDTVDITIRLPRQYYEQFSQFAKFLHAQPMVDPRTNKPVPMIDPNTKQPVIDPKTGQPRLIPSIPGPDIQTFLIICGVNTIKGYQLVQNMMQAQNQGNNANVQPQ